MADDLAADEDGNFAVWTAFARNGDEWININKNKPVTIDDDIIHKSVVADASVESTDGTQLAYSFEVTTEGSSNEKLKEIPKNSQKVNLVCVKEPSKFLIFWLLK